LEVTFLLFDKLIFNEVDKVCTKALPLLANAQNSILSSLLNWQRCNYLSKTPPALWYPQTLDCGLWTGLQTGMTESIIAVMGKHGSVVMTSKSSYYMHIFL